MNLSNVDIYSNDENVANSIKSLDNIMSVASECTDKLEALYNNISTTTLWRENGKEQCVTYLALIKFFSSMISASGSDGLESHMLFMRNALETFKNDSSEFEESGSDGTVGELKNVISGN